MILIEEKEADIRSGSIAGAHIQLAILVRGRISFPLRVFRENPQNRVLCSTSKFY